MYNNTMSRRRSRPLRSGPSLDFSAIALLLALVILPVYFNIQSSISFEPDKSALYRTLALVALLALLRPNRDFSWRHVGAAWARLPLGIRWMFGLVLIMVVATLIGVDPVTSFWGNHERGFGLLSLVSGVIMAVAAYRLVRSGQVWLLIDAIIIAAVLPALYGVLQVLGTDPVTGQAVSFALGQRASSTPGNPLFLADFLLLALPLAGARLILAPPPTRAARLGLGMITTLLVLALIATGSLTALGAGMAAGAFGLVAAGRQQGSRRWTGLGLAILAAGLLLLLVSWVAPTLLPARLGEIFASGGSGGQRLLFWQAVVDLFRHEPRWLLTGLGPDTLPLRLPPYLPPTIAHFEVDWAFRIPDRAHTWMLDTLSMGGVLAVLCGLMVWTVVVAPLAAAASSPRWRTMLPPLAGAVLGASAGTLVVGLGAAPVGLTAGWLAGLLFLFWQQSPQARAHTNFSLTPPLLAALVAHWVFLTFSFRTHASDLLAWALLGGAIALCQPTAPPARPVVSPDTKLMPMLAGAAAAALGFSLSAAWPQALPLWLAGLGLMAGLSWLLAPTAMSRHWGWYLFPSTLLFPAMALNRLAGITAWLAYAWLLVWLLLLLWLLAPRTPGRNRLLLLALPLALALNLPMFGDIAYKSALLTPYDAGARQTLMHRALLLSPFDHNLAAGIVGTEMLSFPPDATLTSPPAQRVRQLYTTAMQAQPQAVEPVAAYAEWLRQRALVDPAATPLAFRLFDQALQMSPHDIETRNRLALLRWQSGNVAEAQDDLQRLLRQDPLYGPTYLHLAQVQQAQSDVDAARATLQAGVEHVPWWPTLVQALAGLP